MGSDNIGPRGTALSFSFSSRILFLVVQASQITMTRKENGSRNDGMDDDPCQDARS
jgi:hypothetical protein